MNGETLDPDGWRTMFPTLFGPTVEPSVRERSEAILTVSLAIADRGDQTRDQLRGALVEALTVELLGRRVRRRGESVVSGASCSMGSVRRSTPTT